MKGNAPPIVIWGAGAIGGTVGAYLIREGVDVLFVDIVEEHVDKINRSGLSIEGPIEEFNVSAKAVLPGALTGKYPAIWLCTKAQHTADAAAHLSKHLADDGHVLSLQNGLNELIIADVVGRGRTIGAFINFGADYLASGRILYGGKGAVVVGELDGSETARLEETHRLLSLFDENAITTPNIWGYLWGKLGYGALLFATALTDDSIADVLAMEKYRPMLARLAGELTALADAQNIEALGFNGYSPAAFAAGSPDAESTQSFDAMVAHNRKSAKTHSGIWRDLAVRKRKSEVDPQLTLPVKIGAELGFEMPLTRRLIALIQDIETGARNLSLDTLDALQVTFEETATL